MNVRVEGTTNLKIGENVNLLRYMKNYMYLIKKQN